MLDGDRVLLTVPRIGPIEGLLPNSEEGFDRGCYASAEIACDLLEFEGLDKSTGPAAQWDPGSHGATAPLRHSFNLHDLFAIAALTLELLFSPLLALGSA